MIVPGRSDRSYGIQVARLAGLPAPVVARAGEILRDLERDELSRGGRPTLSGLHDPGTRQLGLFAAPPGTPAPADTPDTSEVLVRLRALDVDATTPRQALDLLAELKQIAGQT